MSHETNWMDGRIYFSH